MNTSPYNLSFFRRYVAHLGGKIINADEQKEFSLDLVQNFDVNFGYAELVASVTPAQETRISIDECTIFTLFNPYTIKQESEFLAENISNAHQWLVLGRNRKGRIVGKWDASSSRLLCGAIDLSSINYGNIVSNQFKLLTQGLGKPLLQIKAPQPNPFPIYDYLGMLSSFNPDNKSPQFECHGDTQQVDECVKSWRRLRKTFSHL